MIVQYRYEPFQLSDILSEKTIKVPQFQRNVVWNPKKRREFVDTLRNGNPFGSILVHQNENKEYSLVDGLQRISTIKHYCKNPFDYFEYTDINEDLVRELLRIKYESLGIVFDKESDAVKNETVNLQKAIYKKLVDNMDVTSIFFKVIEENQIKLCEESSRIVQKIVEDFEAKKDISGLVVPAIVYTGSSDNLPTIFYNLNTGGVNLSKYETFSSLWDDRKYLVTDEEIINKIYNKYVQMREKSDLEVEISREEIVRDGITLFEYCYSLSEILRDESRHFDVILGTNKKSTDPIGFEILSLILDLPVNKAEQLGLKEKGKLLGASPEFLVELKNIVVKSFTAVKKSLEYWIRAENGTCNTTDSTYMIYHMVMSYVKRNYNIDLDCFNISNVGNKTWNDNFSKYLPLHYLKDYITDFWKINRQVSDLTREINNDISINKYVKNISMNEWNDVLNVFRDYQLNETGIMLSLKTKLFLDYLMKYKLEKNPELNKYIKSFGESFKIDYEHIVPQKRIEEQIGKTNLKGYPVSSIGNVCYLAATDNRTKHEKTLYEYIENRPSFIADVEYLSLIDYPNVEELRFIKYSNFEFDSCYREFIKNRVDLLIKQFKEMVEEKYF